MFAMLTTFLCLQVGELTKERDELLGKLVFCQKSLDEKIKENIDLSVKNADMAKQLKQLQTQMDTIIKDNIQEVGRLNRLIQFQQDEDNKLTV